MTEILNSSFHTTFNQKLSDINHYNGKIRKFCLLFQLGRNLDPFWRTVTKCKIVISGFVVINMFGRSQKCTIFSKKLSNSLKALLNLIFLVNAMNMGWLLFTWILKSTFWENRTFLSAANYIDYKSWNHDFTFCHRCSKRI